MRSAVPRWPSWAGGVLLCIAAARVPAQSTWPLGPGEPPRFSITIDRSEPKPKGRLIDRIATRVLLLLPVFERPWQEQSWAAPIRRELLDRLRDFEGPAYDRRLIAARWLRGAIGCPRLLEREVLITHACEAWSKGRWLLELRGGDTRTTHLNVDVALSSESGNSPLVWSIDLCSRSNCQSEFWNDTWISAPRFSAVGGVWLIFCIGDSRNWRPWRLSQAELMAYRKPDVLAGRVFIPFQCDPPSAPVCISQQDEEIERYIRRSLRVSEGTTFLYCGGQRVWFEAAGPRPQPLMALGLRVSVRNAEGALIARSRVWDDGRLWSGAGDNALCRYLPLEIIGPYAELSRRPFSTPEGCKSLTFEIESDQDMAMRDPSTLAVWQGRVVVKGSDAYTPRRQP